MKKQTVYTLDINDVYSNHLDSIRLDVEQGDHVLILLENSKLGYRFDECSLLDTLHNHKTLEDSPKGIQEVDKQLIAEFNRWRLIPRAGEGKRIVNFTFSPLSFVINNNNVSVRGLLLHALDEGREVKLTVFDEADQGIHLGIVKSIDKDQVYVEVPLMTVIDCDKNIQPLIIYSRGKTTLQGFTTQSKSLEK